MAPTTYHYVEMQFTPAEAARLTGVSPDLQRDWRRRKILPARPTEGHSRYGFSDLCRMVALKAFSDAGVGLKQGKVVDAEDDLAMAASVASMPMLSFAGVPVGVTDPLHHHISRYVIVDDHGVCRTDDLKAYERDLDLRPRHPVSIVFDCKRAAERLVAAIGRPPGAVAVHSKGSES
jgi:DNA-binding transcriptional MerR regulator